MILTKTISYIEHIKRDKDGKVKKSKRCKCC